MADYPHQVSVGHRQRVMLAIALVCRPELLIAEDVTIQAQILQLVMDLRDEFGMAIIMITHNMGVISETADRVLVMYAGWIVEPAPVLRLFDHPLRPDTGGLFSCMPIPERDQDRLIAIPGSLPEPLRRPSGCRFLDGCGLAIPACGLAVPPLRCSSRDTPPPASGFGDVARSHGVERNL